jgi:hypothetical protein
MTMEAIDKKISDAISILNAAEGSENFVCLGSLDIFAALFPPTSEATLQALAALDYVMPGREAVVQNIRMTVLLGAPSSDDFVTTASLHRFFNTAMHFESLTVFSTFIAQGFSIVLTVPSSVTEGHIIAACTFLVHDCGVFLNALAVSDGARGCISRRDASFRPPQAAEQAQAQAQDGVSFRGLGIGGLLLAVLGRVAILQDMHCMYLKSNNDNLQYYTRRGYKVCSMLPVPLRELVAPHVVLDSATLLLFKLIAPAPTDRKKKRRGTKKKRGNRKRKSVHTLAATEDDTEQETEAELEARLSQLDTENDNQLNLPEGLCLVVSEAEEDLDGEDYNTFTAASKTAPAPISYRDYWNVVDDDARFLATKTNKLHQVTQAEVNASFGSTRQALSRHKVLLQARNFEVDTAFMHRQPLAASAKYHILFDAQTLLDLAAVCDLRRPIIIETDDDSNDGKEVSVLVSSYQLNAADTLCSVLKYKWKREKLPRKIRRVVVSVSWLRERLRPEIAKWVDEEMFGTVVQRIPGSDGCADALSLAFSGKSARDKNMVAVPSLHKPAYFDDKPLNYHDAASSLLIREMRKEAEVAGCDYLAPPPDSNTQIVKLKWVPSTKAEHRDTRGDTHGGWRGAFPVSLGAMVVLQECGLPREWVELNFSTSLRRDCQAVALGLAGKRNPKKYLLIPAGDVHDVVSDPPPKSEMLMDVPIKYQQGNSNTCFRDSLASAIHAFGFFANASDLSAMGQLSGCNLQLVQEVSAAVRKIFAKDNLVLVKVFDKTCTISSLQAQDMSWPMVLFLMASDGCYGTHAIAVWKGWIFDSNLPHALRWSQQSLDWCSGAGSTCIGFSRSFRLAPVQYQKHAEPAAGRAVMYGIGAQVWKDGRLGWIMRLPSVKNPSSYHVGFTDGSRTNMNDNNVATLAVRL